MAGDPDTSVPMDFISRVPRPLKFLLVGAFAVAIADISLIQDRLNTAVSLLFLMLGMIGVALAIRLCRGWLTELGDHLDRIEIADAASGDAKTIWLRHLGFFGDDSSAIRYGLIVAIIAPPIYVLNGIVDALDNWRTVAVLALVAISAAVAGAGLGYVINGARAFGAWSREREFILTDSPFGVATIGSRLFWCFVTIYLVQVIYNLSGGLELNSAKPFDFTSSAMLYIGYPVSIFLIFAFFWCQYPIHRKLLAVKRARMAAIDEALERLLLKPPTKLDEAERKELEFLNDVRDRLINIPTWPFRPRLGYSAVIISVISPALSIFGEGLLSRSVAALLGGQN